MPSHEAMPSTPPKSDRDPISGIRKVPSSPEALLARALESNEDATRESNESSRMSALDSSMILHTPTIASWLKNRKESKEGAQVDLNKAMHGIYDSLRSQEGGESLSDDPKVMGRIVTMAEGIVRSELSKDEDVTPEEAYGKMESAIKSVAMRTKIEETKKAA